MSTTEKADLTRSQNIQRWWCVYPCYLNTQKAISEGRKIAKEYTCVNPSVRELAEICQILKLPFDIELNKFHPRDPLTPGRIRILIKHNDNVPVNAEIPNKMAFLKYAGATIPKLKSRTSGSTTSSGGDGGGGKTNKKKGKKGRKKK